MFSRESLREIKLYSRLWPGEFRRFVQSVFVCAKGCRNTMVFTKAKNQNEDNQNTKYFQKDML